VCKVPSDLSKLPEDRKVPARKIVTFLKEAKHKKEIGANIAEIVRGTHLSRYNVVGTLPLLVREGLVRSQKSGSAKVYTLEGDEDE
jgi:hypothetical protein